MERYAITERAFQAALAKYAGLSGERLDYARKLAEQAREGREAAARALRAHEAEHGCTASLPLKATA